MVSIENGGQGKGVSVGVSMIVGATVGNNVITKVGVDSGLATWFVGETSGEIKGETDTIVGCGVDPHATTTKDSATRTASRFMDRPAITLWA